MDNVTFKISGEEHPVTVPKGKKGRRATNYLLSKLGGASGEGLDGIVGLLDDPEFENIHMPIILGLSEKYLEEEGTTIELVNALTTIIGQMFEGFKEPEVEAALGNSEVAQEEGS